MTVVAAFLVPGSPLPLLKEDNLVWGRVASGYRRAARSLASANPDTILIYSTQWMAVLDQLWQTRPRISGLHTDENWHFLGDLPYDLEIDTELSHACVAATARVGISSKSVNYDGFPIDTGTIVADHYLNADKRQKLVLASNNLYHSFEQTRELGRVAAATAKEVGRRVAVVGVGGLSGTIFRDDIDFRNDQIASSEDDRWNKRMLDLIERGDSSALEREIPEFATEAKADMGFKHLAWILGAIDGQYHGGRVHAYGPVYGAGAAVVEFKI